MEFLIQFVLFGVIFGILDGLWLTVVAKQFYQKQIGGLLRKKPDMRYALLFYVLYVLSVVVFVLQPAMQHEAWPVFAMGALFGLVAYGTYDLTNMATLKNWSQRVVLADMAWGALATGVAALLTNLIITGFNL